MRWFWDAGRMRGGLSFSDTHRETIDRPIEPLFGELQWAGEPAAAAADDPRGRSPAEVVDFLRTRGIDTAGLEAALRAGLKWFIVNGLETGPYATARPRLLLENEEAVLDAASRLAAALGITAHLVLDEALPSIMRDLRRRIARRPVTLVLVANVYPQDHPSLLFQLVTGNELPLGQSPAELGVWILNVETLLHAQRVLFAADPPSVMVLTVAGDAVQRPGHYLMPAGTSLGTVLQRVGLCEPPARIVIGAALTGRVAGGHDEPVSLGVSGLYAWTRAALPRGQPSGCIRCGLCIEVCPVAIEPISIYGTVEAGRPERAARMRPWACIDCGLCDYVCPSELPLMNGVREAQGSSTEGHRSA